MQFGPEHAHVAASLLRSVDLLDAELHLAAIPGSWGACQLVHPSARPTLAADRGAGEVARAGGRPARLRTANERARDAAAVSGSGSRCTATSMKASGTAARTRQARPASSQAEVARAATTASASPRLAVTSVRGAKPSRGQARAPASPGT
jgi:hypothetical protein